MYRPRSRVLAGMASLAIGGCFVAASAIGATAAPAPTTTAAQAAANVAGCGEDSFFPAQNKKGGVPTQTPPAGTPVNAGQQLSVLYSDESPMSTTGGFAPQALVNGQPSSAVAITTAPVANGPDKYNTLLTITVPNTVNTGDTFGIKAWDSDQNKPGGDCGVVSWTVAQAAPRDVSISISTPPPAHTGDTVSYTIVVNNQMATATDKTITVTDPAVANVTFTSVSGGSGWTNCTGLPVACSWTGSLAPKGSPGDQTSAITLTGTVTGPAGDQILNIATVAMSDDTVAANNTAQALTPILGTPGIAVDKSATPQVNVGDPITYTVFVTNSGTGATTSPISMVDDVPSAVTFDHLVSAPSWSCPAPAQHLVCNYTGPALAGGASTPTITFVGIATANAVPQVINTAFATMGNQTVHDDAKTIVNVPTDLHLSKSADPASGSDVDLGQTITYTLHYSNTGTLPANGAVISDTVPTGLTWTGNCSDNCTSNGSTLHWTVNIPGGGSGDVSFTATVNSDDTNGQVIDNVGDISFNGNDVPSNHTHHRVFVPSGALRLHKSVSYTAPAGVGTVLTYSLVASATGNMDQTDVVVTDDVPAGTSYVDSSATCSAAGCTADKVGNTVTWSWPTLSPGSPVTLTFQVKVSPADASGTIPTEIINVGSIRSHQTPPTPSNEVIVPLTQVLGTKIVKPTTLPFTGLNSLQDALLAAVLIGAGMMILTWPRLQSQSRRVA